MRAARSVSSSPATTQATGPERRVGRPRRPGVDQRILDATLAQLVGSGYAALRVDDVAAEAGVAKTTLYRRWTSKESLVADAVSRLFADSVQPVDLGDLRSDLLALLRESYTLVFDGPGRVLEDLVRESGTSRELSNVVKATTQVRRRYFHQAMNRGVARGELDPSVDHDLFIDILVGPLWTHCLVTGDRLAEGDLERIVDTVLDGARLPSST
jgi:AcrR family transcriptional regulator